MPLPKLFIYPSDDNTRAVIIYSEGKYNRYMQILWHMKDDIFEEGQWITGRKFAHAHSGLSKDGKLFIHHFSQFRPGDLKDEVCVSKPPYFTALAYFLSCGRYDMVKFNNKGTIVSSVEPLKNEGNLQIETIKMGDHINGLYKSVKKDSFTDLRGRKITHNMGVLYADEIILKDFTQNNFTFVSHPPDYYKNSL